jgi:hypothetical protein
VYACRVSSRGEKLKFTFRAGFAIDIDQIMEDTRRAGTRARLSSAWSLNASCGTMPGLDNQFRSP